MRIETDLLGSKEVDDDCYYGIHTQRAIENFRVSKQTINDMPEVIHGMVHVKRAVALTNKALKVIDPKIADAIVSACNLILSEGKCLDQFPVDVFQGGAGTSINMNTNEVIANLALEILGYEKGRYDIISPCNDVDMSQSTNDVYPTGLRLAFYSKMQNLVTALEYLKEGILEKAEAFDGILKMGRTQLQDAVPMSVGQEFRAFASMLESEIAALHMTTDKLLTFSIGATAIGSGVNTPDEYEKCVIKYLSDALDATCYLAPDLFAATYDCADFVTLHSGLKRAAIRIGKICNDLRLLSSGPRTGLKELNLPELQAGSSNMPAKINPVIPELVNQVCFKVIGNDMTITMAADAGQLQLNVMEPVIVQSMYESISLLRNACFKLRDRCIDGITVNVERCHDFVYNSIGIVTYLKPYIGHDACDRIGKICAETGKNVKEVVLEENLLSPAEVDQIFSEANLLCPHSVEAKF